MLKKGPDLDRSKSDSKRQSGVSRRVVLTSIRDSIGAGTASLGIGAMSYVCFAGGDDNRTASMGPVDLRNLIGGDGEIGDALREVISSGREAWLDAGRYTIAGVVDIGGASIRAHPDATVFSHGNGESVFEASGNLGPALRVVGNLSQGATTFELSQVTVAPGDWLILFDPRDSGWSRSRIYYRSGEWCQVALVQGKSVVLTQPLRNSYDGNVISVFRPSLSTVGLFGGKWRTGAKSLARLALCKASQIVIGSVNSHVNEAIRLDRCVEARIEVGEGANFGEGRDDYLVGVGNSFRVHVTGGRLFGRRHAIAFGGGDMAGGVPNRECLATGCELHNDAETGVAAADIHGNCEGCGYRGCKIYGGVSLGGADPICSDCVIYARKDGNLAEITEFLGGVVDMRNTLLVTDARKVGGGRGLIDFGTQNAQFSEVTVRDTLLDLSGLRLNAPNLAIDESVIRVNNQGSRSRFSVKITGASINVPNRVQFIRTGGRGGIVTRGEFTLTAISGLPSQSKIFYSERGFDDRFIVRVK